MKGSGKACKRLSGKGGAYGGKDKTTGTEAFKGSRQPSRKTSGRTGRR